MVAEGGGDDGDGAVGFTRSVAVEKFTYGPDGSFTGRVASAAGGGKSGLRLDGVNGTLFNVNWSQFSSSAVPYCHGV
ncbi:hypothetical protein ETD86_06955 [Nonomuraea turkmeniaca]|uniref:Uncharacterized protein n=1 Tax=Nonomuraea turkmeniaca TaxID=103838 RepID=A0A5S4GCG8_9ACTN|nr:hypothetical protein ETD86_06955 [Nonomuraea turkmeniaca]